MMTFLFVIPVNAEEDARTLEEGYYPKNSEVYRNASPAMKSMFDLQNEITEHLGKKDGKYVYDYETIKNIVYSYDFTEINKELGQTWTKETFLGTVILNIESTEVESRTKRAYVTGRICNVNKTDKIWNSRREYRDRQKTSVHIYKLRLDADSISAAWTLTKESNIQLLMALYPVYPGLSLAITLGGLAKEVPVRWMKGVANSLTNSNNKGYCGTVLDINSFTSVYSSWNQFDN